MDASGSNRRKKELLGSNVRGRKWSTQIKCQSRYVVIAKIHRFFFAHTAACRYLFGNNFRTNARKSMLFASHFSVQNILNRQSQVFMCSIELIRSNKTFSCGKVLSTRLKRGLTARHSPWFLVIGRTCGINNWAYLKFDFLFRAVNLEFLHIKKRISINNNRLACPTALAFILILTFSSLQNNSMLLLNHFGLKQNWQFQKTIL